jgi:hypothetical protein
VQGLGWESIGVGNEDRETVQHISDTLDEVLAVLKKPRNRFLSILEIAGAVVSVLALFGIIEIIRNWFFGG